MNETAPLFARIIRKLGVQRVATEAGVSRQAVHLWLNKGRLPRTEWTGETDHAGAISRLTGGVVKRDELLASVQVDRS